MADQEKIEEKIAKGEELTPEEEKAVMQGEDAPAAEAGEEKEVDPSKVTPETASKEDAADEEDDDEDEEESEDEDDGEDSSEDDDEEEADETPSDKGADTAKAKEEEAEEEAATEAERKAEIEAESEKPLDQADISKYSPLERTLFFELRKERRKRQESQREADTLKFARRKEALKKQQEEREAAEAEEEDVFEGKEDDDLLTVGEIKKALQKTKAKPKAGEVDPEQVERVKANRLQERVWIFEAKEKGLSDVVEVVKHAQDILGDDQDAEAEVREVVASGGNAVVAIYNLIKAHPRFHEVEKKLSKTSTVKKKEDDAAANKERAKRIETNKKKPVTTGGAGGGMAPKGEYSIQELLDMPEEKFSALPKEQRDKVLQAL